VSIDGGQTADALCLTPWVPIFVNNGHECILAEAYHDPLDPLPGTPDFNVPTDRHVAQRNLSVVQTLAARSFQFAFEAHNAGRKARAFVLKAAVGDVEQLKPMLPLLGRDFRPPRHKARVRHLGFVSLSGRDVRDPGDAVPDLKTPSLRPHGRAGYSLVGTLEGEGAVLIHVTQEADGRVIGGLGVLVLSAQESKA